ncbi:MAG: AAA family ATPase [Kiritimatiellae bacterium]|nr:AAA family ATPase [Kiritimatiellia bacterium]
MSVAVGKRTKEIPETIKILRRIALSFEPGELTESTFVKAVLAEPNARAAAVRVTPYSELELPAPTPLPANLCADKPNARWPAAVRPKDWLPARRGLGAAAWGQKALLKFVAQLYRETPEPLWYRRQIADSFDELLGKVKAAALQCGMALPAQKEAIRKLAGLILEQAGLALAAEGGARPIPIFVFGRPGHGMTTVLRTFAAQLGCRFLPIQEDVTTTGELLSALENSPPAVIEANGCLSCMGGAVHALVTFFLHGQAAREDCRTGEFDLHARDSGMLDTAMKRSVVVFPIPLPDRLVAADEHTPEELATLLHNEQLAEVERNPGIRETPKATWSLIRDHNSVIFETTSCRHLVHVLDREIKRLRRFFRESGCRLDLRIESKLKLAALLILEQGYPTPRDARGAVTHLLHEIAQRVTEGGPACAGVYRLQIEQTNGELPPLLARRARPTRAWFNALERQALQLTYSGHRLTYTLRVDREAGTVTIGGLSMRAPKAVAGGKYLIARPKTRFGDVIGLDEAKERLRALVRYFQNPDSFRRLEAVPPRRILLTGAPGTGKTLLAQAFAGEAGLPFFSISAAEVTSQKYAGQGGTLLREVFNAAMTYRPSIIFVDELDSMGKRNALGGDSELAYDAKSILNTFLVLLDGVGTAEDIVVIGATNRPEDIDPALLRPKRFGVRIEAEPLKPEQRKALIRLNLSERVCAGAYTELVDYLARRTAGPFTPAEIEDMVNQAKLLAEEEGARQVSADVLARAIDRIVLGKKFRELSPEYRKASAYHEASHAVALRALLPEKKIERLTIGARSVTAGMLLWSEDDSKAHGLSRDELLALMVVALAGPIGEELLKGHWDIGAGDDLERATTLAAYAVSDLGIGLGMRGAVLCYLTQKGDPWPQAFQEHVARLVEACCAVTRELMGRLRSHVDALAAVLAEREDMGQDDVERIVGCVEVDRSAVLAPLVGDRTGTRNGNTSPVAAAAAVFSVRADRL